MKLKEVANVLDVSLFYQGWFGRDRRGQPASRINSRCSCMTTETINSLWYRGPESNRHFREETGF
jgi:hypothetical protein